MIKICDSYSALLPGLSLIEIFKQNISRLGILARQVLVPGIGHEKIKQIILDPLANLEQNMVIIIEENYLSALFEENKTKIEAGEIEIEKMNFHIWIKFYSI